MVSERNLKRQNANTRRRVAVLEGAAVERRMTALSKLYRNPNRFFFPAVSLTAKEERSILQVQEVNPLLNRNQIHSIYESPWSGKFPSSIPIVLDPELANPRTLDWLMAAADEVVDQTEIIFGLRITTPPISRM
jgi:hypothetical protein